MLSIFIDIKRQEWLESQKHMMKEAFKPSGKVKHHEKGNHNDLINIVNTLGQEIDLDYGDSDFDIYCDDQGLIILQFKLDTIDNENGLLAYMNILLKRHSICSEYGLSKVIQLWNHTARKRQDRNDQSTETKQETNANDDDDDDDADMYIYYALKPAWVKIKRI